MLWYNKKDIFKNKETIETLSIVQYKESKIKKFINKIKEILKKVHSKKMSIMRS